jgi:hypothetical protein
MLKPLPTTFAETRVALHKVAEAIVAPARKPDNEIALTVTPGGFGTPPFEHDGRSLQVRVQGGELVVDADSPGTSADTETRAPLRTLAQAGAVVGAELLPDGLPEDDEDLFVDAEAAEALGEFYAFAAEVLAAFKDSLPNQADASDTNLWPEHFDVAFDAGVEAAGHRAGYGASPGDENHPEPYLYVSPWSGEVSGELWNAKGFTGAELTYAELLAADDPAASALAFFRDRFEALAAA